jgi:hypothetical protein
VPTVRIRCEHGRVRAKDLPLDMRDRQVAEDLGWNPAGVVDASIESKPWCDFLGRQLSARSVSGFQEQHS